VVFAGAGLTGLVVAFAGLVVVVVAAAGTVALVALAGFAALGAFTLQVHVGEIVLSLQICWPEALQPLAPPCPAQQAPAKDATGRSRANIIAKSGVHLLSACSVFIFELHFYYYQLQL
jgi:hypothetical protein